VVGRLIRVDGRDKKRLPNPYKRKEMMMGSGSSKKG